MGIDLTLTRYMLIADSAVTGSTPREKSRLTFVDLDLDVASDRKRLVEIIIDHNAFAGGTIIQAVAFDAHGVRDISRDVAGEIVAELQRRIAFDPECADDINDRAVAFVHAQGWTLPERRAA